MDNYSLFRREEKRKRRDGGEKRKGKREQKENPGKRTGVSADMKSKR